MNLDSKLASFFPLGWELCHHEPDIGLGAKERNLRFLSPPMTHLSLHLIQSVLSSSMLFLPVKKLTNRARRDSVAVKVLALNIRDPIWTPVLIPSSSLFMAWESSQGQPKTLDGFSSSCCNHLWSESSEGRSSSLSLLSAYLPFQ